MKPASLLRWYPRAWRDRYGEELLALIQDTLDEGHPAWRLRLGVAWGGLRERGRQTRRAAAASVRRRVGPDRWGTVLMAGLVCAVVPGQLVSAPYPARAWQAVALGALLAAVAVAIGLWAAAGRHLTLTPRVRAFHLVLGAIIPNAVSMVVVTLGIWWWATQSSVTLLLLTVTNLALTGVLAPGKIGRAVRRGRPLQAAASGATVINPSVQRTHGRHRT